MWRGLRRVPVPVERPSPGGDQRVAERLGGFQDALARFLTDVGTPVQGARDSPDRDVQMPGKIVDVQASLSA